jgi:glycosyltransferase involved in cell wall biosynthesis
MSLHDAPVRLSLVMPVYNEAATLPRVLKHLGSVELPVAWELIVVDDGSTDGGCEQVLREWVPQATRVVMTRARRNQGKGAALRRGFALAQGDILGVQDADLEYDPSQLPALLGPLLDGTAEVVFGSRQFGASSSYSFWYVVGNKAMSLVASALFDRYVTDAYTGSKFFTRRRYEQLRLTADGFEIEAELTGGLLRTGARVFELPITYTARGREDGKKIRATDGLRGAARLLRVRLRGY